MNLAPEPARPEEAAAIHALLEAAFAGYARRLGRARAGPFEWVEQAIAEGRVHVLRRGGELAAVAKLSDCPSERSMVLDILAVAPAASGQGLGSALLAWFDDHARALGRRTVKLHTAKMMTHLVDFYHRHGYEDEGIGPAPSGRDGHPRLFMHKRLDGRTD